LVFAIPTSSVFASIDDEEGDGRSAVLSPPEGAPFPDARGEVVLNKKHLIVEAEGLPPGEYDVLLDDGTGTKTSIGTLTVKAEDEEEGDDEEGEEGEAEEEDDDDGGHLKLTGDALPFGAESPSDLGGRAICVKDSEGTIFLQGTTPSPIAGGPQLNGRCPLSLPDPATDEDAEGVLKLEQGEGRIVVKVHLKNLEAGGVYTVCLTNPADSTTEALGMVTINPGGNGQFKVDTEKGDAIPFGAGSLADLEGFGITVKDAAGVVVLVGTVCPAQVKEPEEEEEEEEEPEEGDGGGGALDPVEPFFLLVGEFDTPLLRGDANSDRVVDISDAMKTLLYLFNGGSRPLCLDAADTNDDGSVDISDPVSLLDYLFSGGPRPVNPGVMISGSDPTADNLYCQEIATP
jgi:hypothetical protein